MRTKKGFFKEFYKASDVRRITPELAKILINLGFVTFSSHGKELYITDCGACSERERTKITAKKINSSLFIESVACCSFSRNLVEVASCYLKY